MPLAITVRSEEWFWVGDAKVLIQRRPMDSKIKVVIDAPPEVEVHRSDRMEVDNGKVRRGDEGPGGRRGKAARR